MTSNDYLRAAKQNIFRLMKERKITPAELSRMVCDNYDDPAKFQQLFTKWKKGQTVRGKREEVNPSLDKIVQIAEVLGVDPLDLMREDMSRGKTLADAAEALRIVAETVGLPDGFHPKAGFLDCCLNSSGQYVPPDDSMMEGLDRLPLADYNVKRFQSGKDLVSRAILHYFRAVQDYYTFQRSEMAGIAPQEVSKATSKKHLLADPSRKYFSLFHAKLTAAKDLRKEGFTLDQLKDLRAYLQTYTDKLGFNKVVGGVCPELFYEEILKDDSMKKAFPNWIKPNELYLSFWQYILSAIRDYEA